MSVKHRGEFSQIIVWCALVWWIDTGFPSRPQCWFRDGNRLRFVVIQFKVLGFILKKVSRLVGKPMQLVKGW